MWLHPKGCQRTLLTTDNGKAEQKNAKDNAKCYYWWECHLVLQKAHGKSKSLNHKNRLGQVIFGRSAPFLHDSVVKKQVYALTKSARWCALWPSDNICKQNRKSNHAFWSVRLATIQSNTYSF